MSTFTVTITENTTEPGDNAKLAQVEIYSQTFATLDTGKVIAFLNAPVKPKRIYKSRVKTEAKS